jgi:hypothetical protein
MKAGNKTRITETEIESETKDELHLDRIEKK